MHHQIIIGSDSVMLLIISSDCLLLFSHHQDLSMRGTSHGVLRLYLLYPTGLRAVGSEAAAVTVCYTQMNVAASFNLLNLLNIYPLRGTRDLQVTLS